MNCMNILLPSSDMRSKNIYLLLMPMNIWSIFSLLMQASAVLRLVFSIESSTVRIIVCIGVTWTLLCFLGRTRIDKLWLKMHEASWHNLRIVSCARGAG
jgi:hypothetical protein